MAGGLSPDGTIIWTSGSLPGRSHDLTAARLWGILPALEWAGILTLANTGNQGDDGPSSHRKGKNKPDSHWQANRVHARLRSR